MKTIISITRIIIIILVIIAIGIFITIMLTMKIVGSIGLKRNRRNQD